MSIEKQRFRDYLQREMLDDRDYMRQVSGGLNWSATVGMIIALIVVFLLQMTVLPLVIPLGYLVLSLDGLRHGYVWQLVSFQFLHAGWLHLLFNLLAIYFFGRSVEFVLGRRRWLILYFLSGILGGVTQMLVALLVPRFFDAPVVGASAGAAGLIAAFALLNWDQPFTLLFYFIPVTMRGKTLFWFSIGLAVFGMVIGGGGGAHAAHLGGFLAGYAYMRWGAATRQSVWGWHTFYSRPRRRELVRTASIRAPAWTRSAPERPGELPSEEFISREVDPILDKISAHGIQSLTERERRILEAARHKMAR
jgi:membrane associated rhomboid family serine protease